MHNRSSLTINEQNQIYVMGLFDGILGNASKVQPEQIAEEFSRILSPDEKIEHAYKLVRDLFLFTDKRLLLVDKQGLTGKKIEYHSIPYSKITHFSIETSGHFDLDADLKIWVSGMSTPLEKNFNKKVNIYEVQGVLNSYVSK